MTSRIAFLSLFSLCAVACGSDEEVIITDSTAALPDNAADALETYADIVLASYKDSLSAAEDMDAALQALVDDPSEATMSTARIAWIASREPYLQTEVYRFYGGPIDNEEGPEGLLNAWPMDESYVDYVAGAMGAEMGIINDVGATISGSELVGLNEEGADTNIATGYHAIEFLLWGQDTSDTGPGDRPFTDYVTGDTGTAANQDRRGQYLMVTSELLQGHLKDLVEAWETGEDDNYRAEFLAMEPKIALGLITSGAAILAGFETGGERLEAALLAQDQEEEHSCFSDNTHRDMIQDIQGVQNVWLGTYNGDTKVSGAGLRDIFAAEDESIADEITAEIANGLELAIVMEKGGYFDQLIGEGNTAGNALVQDVIDSLVKLEELLEDDAMPLFDLAKIDPG